MRSAVVALLFAAVAMVGLLLVWATIDTIATLIRGSSPAQRAADTGSLLSLAIQWALGVVICVGLVRLALGLQWPERYSRDARLKAKMAEICLQEQGVPRDSNAGEAASGECRHWSTEELLDVYKQIDRELVPDRFREVIAEIRRRHETGQV